MGYYPTPERTEAILAEQINAAYKTGLIRMIDPCAGTGKALAQLAASLRNQGATAQTYGVEAQAGRAAEAAQVLDQVLPVDMFCTGISHGAFQVALVNPPYDFDASQVDQKHRTERLEYTFLQHSIPLLATDGLLIYIVPVYALDYDVCRLLTDNFSNVRCYTLPPEEYKRFRQVVVFGRKRSKSVGDYEAARRLQDQAHDQQIIDACDQSKIERVTARRDMSWFTDLEAAATYSRTVSDIRVWAQADPRDRVTFKHVSIREDEAIALYMAGGAHTTREWQDLTEPKKEYRITPPAPLKTGHIAGVMASGQIGTTQIGRVILRGHTSRVTEWRNNKGEVIGENSPDAEIETERIIPSVITLDLSTGKTEVIADENVLAAFLASHAKDLATFVQNSCKPLYEGATWEEWQSISQYALTKKYPGHPGGLSHSQKHVALATANLLKERGYAFLIGEQGTGKTVMSPAAVAYLHSIDANALPAWVLCPSHLVEKWQREIEAVVPDAKAIICASITDLDAARLIWQSVMAKPTEAKKQNHPIAPQLSFLDMLAAAD